VTEVLRGVSGAVAAGHALGVGAGLHILGAGGTAADAVIAAQAVLCVVMPDACGLGGDGMFLVSSPEDGVVAVNGAGRLPAAAGPEVVVDGAASVTVPGLVQAWADLHARWGRLGLPEVLAPAVRIARAGHQVGRGLAEAVRVHRGRLLHGGAARWALLEAGPGEVLCQPQLADVLAEVGRHGPDAFYRGAVGEAIVAAVQRRGGSLAAADLSGHRSVITLPVCVPWGDGLVYVQPPSSQGILLAMALQWLERAGPPAEDLLDHVGIELVEAVFAHRDGCAARGVALLDEPLRVELARAGRRGGPRGYLHTAGVATADAAGMVVSSLASVFDDFGSATYVPAGGFLLNNRAAGFTVGPNAPAPGRLPVHTLAPALVETDGTVTALSTPGADGQVQTLLQVLCAMRYRGKPLAAAIGAPRWRSEAGVVLIPPQHPAREALARLGHRLASADDGDVRFGAVVSAASTTSGPTAVSDWRRQAAAGVI
jgi:gamma-glutamyltranspeptidase/glutathione hydrolase